ncbi:MAG: aspartate/glutamate racemase family protein [Thermotogae bacterium]|nr:aspartate/glutamate racemase family protein [Thermotogota bacterium]
MKTVGIIGGMGPESSYYLYGKIISLTPASTDQEHIHVIIDSYPQIPDRTAYLLSNGPSPVPYLIESAQKLEYAGADLIVMACNTAHAFYQEVKQSIKVDMLNMIEETVIYVNSIRSRCVGVLATTGTLKTKLYQRALDKYGIKVLTPNEEENKMIMKAIYGKKGIKAGYVEEPRKFLLGLLNEMFNSCDVIIAGCTEVSLAIGNEKRVIDSVEILARKIVQVCKGEGD